MLEIRNITKVYHSKSGNSVKALDNVSVTFPETGMVFVLGKSGSGKSTLLNVIGGLDGCDSGEFIIKGKSSKQFAGSDFDAYRNTFIGFIFQEYNVLDDFSVGANIGLALELQGKKATNEKISEILRQVDMLDYAKRKPNELSGGQKQRVAIARALVKDPEIIMADEPTGALDSNTGKQIFDTLKELSKTKLVIVVSHDRDFAERYGDRIIEMKDGQILTDVTKHEVEAEVLSRGILKMTDKLLRIEKGYQLTPKDVDMINEYLRAQTADIIISGDGRLNDGVRSAAGISEDNRASIFNDTDDLDVKTKDYKASETKFIRSRLPMKNAIKMGGNSLGHKKFRLVVTIFLSLIAFTLFGFADTLGAYNKFTAATQSITDSYIRNASVSLSVKHTWIYPDNTHSYYSTTPMNDDDIGLLYEKTGLEFVPVYNGSFSEVNTISLSDHMISTEKISFESAYTGNLYGLVSLDENRMNQLGFRVVGKMPENSDEIAISELMFRQLKLTGFRNNNENENVKENELTMNDDGSANSIIGKHIDLRMFGRAFTFKITAVIDTDFEYDRYASYVPSESGSTPDGEENAIVDMIMLLELQNSLRYGFHSLGYVTEDALETMAAMNMFGYGPSLGTNMNWQAGIYMDQNNGEESFESQLQWLNGVAQSSDISALGNITWLDGKSSIGTNEMLVHKSILNNLRTDVNIYDKVVAILDDLYGDYLSEEIYDIGSAIRQAAIEKYINDDAVFNSIKNELKAKCSEYYGNPTPTDDDLRVFWRECMEWNTQWLPAGTKTSEELYSEGCRDFLGALLGDDFGEGLPDAFFEWCIGRNLYFNGDELNFSNDIALDFLVYEYACDAVYNDEIYKNEDFVNIVLKNYGFKEDNWDEMSDDDKKTMSVDAYFQYVRWYGDNSFSDKTVEDFITDAMNLYEVVTGESVFSHLEDVYLRISFWKGEGETVKKYTEYKIVGLFDGSTSDLVVSDSLYALHDQYLEDMGYGKEIIAPHAQGIYAFAIAPMPSDPETIDKLVNLHYEEGGDLKFSLENQVMDSLDNFNEFIEMGSKIFLYIGIGFAVFSALMLMNFISVSISYKRREIGILRAVGARSSDVFKIFFSEAFMIALINFVLSLAATITATTVFNNVVRNAGINVTLLSFGVRQVVLMLVISIFVAAIASFLPVWNIARRKPVDAIKNK